MEKVKASKQQNSRIKHGKQKTNLLMKNQELNIKKKKKRKCIK